MTIPSTTRKAGPLLGDGSQTAWPFTFKVFSTGDVAVTVANALGVETLLVLDTDYSVALNPNQNTSPGGTVTYPISGAALPTGSVLTIAGDVDYDQALAVPTGGNFNPTTFERQLDRMVMQIQQLREQLNRAVRVGVTSDANATLPAPVANNIIGWDSTATILQNVPLSDLATAIAFATYRYDTYTGDGVEDTFALSADPVSLGNIDVSVDGITYVPGVDHTLVGTSLVFTTPPPNGAEILARYGQALPPSALASASEVTFTPDGGVSRTVEDKLREVVSVGDHLNLAAALAAANAAGLPLQATPTIDAGVTGAQLKQGFITGHIAIGNGMTEINSFAGIQGNEFYVNTEQEVRGVSYVVHNARTTPDEATLGWDFFGLTGVVVVDAGNTQYLRGNHKAVTGELYYRAPTSGTYAVKTSHNFQANIPELGAGVTLENWYGYVVNTPAAGGAITNGYGLYVLPMTTGITNAAAIRIGGTGDGGQIKWNNTRITELATGKMEIDLGTTMIKEDSSGKLELDLNSKQLVHTNMLTSTTVGAAGAASALPATPAFYERVLVGGVEYKRPYYPA